MTGEGAGAALDEGAAKTAFLSAVVDGGGGGGALDEDDVVVVELLYTGALYMELELEVVDGASVDSGKSFTPGVMVTVTVITLSEARTVAGPVKASSKRADAREGFIVVI